jgi:hypothetical protein
MSYLRGPLTRQQIKGLMEGKKLAETPIPTAPAAATAPPPSPREESAAMETSAVASRPILPPGVPQYFLGDGREGAFHSPGLLGLAAVHYVDRRSKKEIHREEVALTVALAEGLIDLDWEDAAEIEIEERQLSEKAPPGASFGEVPDSAAKAPSYAKWRKELSDHLYRSKGLDLLRSPTFELTSEPLESERDFRIRLREVAHERRDEEKEKLRSKYASKIQKLEEKIRKARQTLEKEREQARGQRLQTAISVGATILAAVTGRKRLSYSTLSKATTAEHPGPYPPARNPRPRAGRAVGQGRGPV